MPTFLTFERQPDEPSRKTAIVRVLQKSSGQVLGTIRWYGAWRQFAFYPAATTLYSAGCLEDINMSIRELMDEWRATKRADEL